MGMLAKIRRMHLRSATASTRSTCCPGTPRRVATAPCGTCSRRPGARPRWPPARTCDRPTSATCAIWRTTVSCWHRTARDSEPRTSSSTARSSAWSSARPASRAPRTVARETPPPAKRLRNARVQSAVDRAPERKQRKPADRQPQSQRRSHISRSSERPTCIAARRFILDASSCRGQRPQRIAWSIIVQTTRPRADVRGHTGSQRWPRWRPTHGNQTPAIDRPIATNTAPRRAPRGPTNNVSSCVLSDRDLSFNRDGPSRDLNS